MKNRFKNGDEEEIWEEDDDETQVMDYFCDSKQDPIPNIQEMSARLKKVAKIIDILEFVDSCLIVSERFLKDDEEAKKLIEEIRDKILDTETIFTDYLVSGKINKPV